MRGPLEFIRSRRPKLRPVEGRRNGRAFSSAEKSQIAWLAGSGHSAAEIADAIGNTTAATIYAHVRRQGIALVAKPPSSVAFVVRATRVHFDVLMHHAIERHADPADLASRLLQIVISSPTLLANLLDEEEDR
jgi:hypothetical protein